MIPFRPLYGQAQVCFILFASFALAALQNVTVDDSVSTGAVVPQYLPNSSIWNQGNNCSICLVKPDPSLAYNGTWHDATFSSSNGYTQTVEFSFTGRPPDLSRSSCLDECSARQEVPCTYSSSSQTVFPMPLRSRMSTSCWTRIS